MDEYFDMDANDNDGYNGDEAIEDNRGLDRSPGNENEDNQNAEGAEDKVDVEAKKKRPGRKLFRLNAELLKGERGLRAINGYFKDLKFKGKGYEKQDLDSIMKRLEHWAHRMYPKYNLDDSLITIEKLGKKREIQNHLMQIRTDTLPEQIFGDQNEEPDNENEMEMPPIDEFDELIDQQIALSKTNPHQDRTHHQQTHSQVPSQSFNQSTSHASQFNLSGISSMEQHPNLPTSTQQEKKFEMTEEMRKKIAENRLKAIERMKQRQQALAEAEKTNLEVAESQTEVL